MIKKIAPKKDETKTLNILPIKGFLGLLADAAVVTTLITATISLLLMALTLAQKITITVGK